MASFPQSSRERLRALSHLLLHDEALRWRVVARGAEAAGIRGAAAVANSNDIKVALRHTGLGLSQVIVKGAGALRDELRRGVLDNMSPQQLLDFSVDASGHRLQVGETLYWSPAQVLEQPSGMKSSLESILNSEAVADAQPKVIGNDGQSPRRARYLVKVPTLVLRPEIVRDSPVRDVPIQRLGVPVSESVPASHKLGRRSARRSMHLPS